MAGFTYRLEHDDGTPADPPTLASAVPNWRARRHDPSWTLDAARGRDPRRRCRPASGVDRGGGVLDTRAMSAEQVALIPRCAECDAVWLPADEEHWCAYLGGDAVDEPGRGRLLLPRVR
jgi:hypothetical protein